MESTSAFLDSLHSMPVIEQALMLVPHQLAHDMRPWHRLFLEVSMSLRNM
jgi:hypothetical protein